MRFFLPRRGVIACLSFLVIAAGTLDASIARAEGTVTIVQPDGHTDVYRDVVIKVIHGGLYMTSADGKGTLIVHRAACSYQGAIMVCFATSAMLVQAGGAKPLDFKSGTLYVNPSDDFQPLAMSSTKIAPHSIMFSCTTKRGTYISLTGRIDRTVE